jgi:outer membrane lipoprotein SlyB
MNIKKITFLLVASMLVSSVACTNMSNEEQGTLTGGAIGAVVGGGIAAATGGDGWTGAAIGAIAGGVIGNIKGKDAD